MKKILFLFMLLGLIPNCSAQQGEVTFSYIFGGLSRGGFIIGYNLTDDFAIDAHLGALPHFWTYGLTAKIRLKDGDNDHFALVGISRVGGYNYIKKETGLNTGLNLGYRFELHAHGDGISYPFEFGICPFLTKTKIIRDPLQDDSNAKQENEVPENDSKKEEPEDLPFTIFFGAGIQGAKG